MHIDDDSDIENPPSKLTTNQRLLLLERDTRSHARSLTTIVENLGAGFSPVEMKQLRDMFREELADAGLRIDGPEHVDDAREDFRFLRRFRVGMNGLAGKIGWAVIIAIVGAAITLFTMGLNAWKGSP